MFRLESVLVLVVVVVVLAAPGRAAGDAMLERLVRGGAARAAVCGERGAAGCAAALWGRYWLLARASCVQRAPVPRAPVLLHAHPDACRYLPPDLPVTGDMEALVHFIHPGYAPQPSDEWDDPEPDPLDAAFILLSAPAPPTIADNHTATCELLPELSSWLRYIPSQVPWTNVSAPAPRRVKRSRLLSSPLRMLLSTIVAPVVALLLTFLLLLRWPEREADDKQTIDEKMLVESDALCGEAA